MKNRKADFSRYRAIPGTDEIYKLLIENTSDYVSLIDLSGQYIYLSPSHSHLGYAPEELIGKSATAMLHPEDKVQLVPLLAEVVKRLAGSKLNAFLGIKQELNATNLSFRWPDKSGKWHYIESTPDLVKNPAGQGYAILLISRDVTEHRQEEEALKESEEKYRTLINNLQEGVFILQDFKVRYANEAFARLGDYSLEDVIGKDFRRFIAPEDLTMVVYRYLQRLAGRKVPREYELRMMHRDGKTRITVNLNVGVITYFGREAIMGTARDITDRKRNEKTLQEREHFLNNIFSSIQDGISVLDSELNIMRVNPAMERWYAHAKPLVGKKCYLAYHGRSEPCDACPSNRTIETGEAAVEVIPRISGENKITGWLDVYSFPLADNETGEISGVIEYVRDISEIKKAEELQRENRQLAYTSKAKSDFLANMSHELRTPLNSIIGFSELMKMNSGLDEKNNHYLENILTSGKYLLNLINDILDLSKVEAGKIELYLELINVPSIINESLNLINEKASRKNLLLKKEFDASLLFIEADRQRFKQMLFNLLSNAVKFSKKGGGTITITTKKEGDMARISVSDTGIGIKEDDMGRLFNEFEQLDSGISRKYGGSGLGLAITKKLVELHGGTITVESRYGEGSTFTLSLPLLKKKKSRM